MGDDYRRFCRTTYSQYEKLLRFMEKNHEVLSGKLSCAVSSKRKKQKWEEIAKILNADGIGPQRSGDRWRTVWNDWKCYVKKKAIAIKSQQSQSKTGSAGKKELSPLEEGVVALIGDIALYGDEPVPESGVSSDQQEENEPQITLEFYNSDEEVHETHPFPDTSLTTSEIILGSPVRKRSRRELSGSTAVEASVKAEESLKQNTLHEQRLANAAKELAETARSIEIVEQCKAAAAERQADAAERWAAAAERWAVAAERQAAAAERQAAAAERRAASAEMLAAAKMQDVQMFLLSSKNAKK